LSYLLFFIYTVLCCWLLTRIRFVKNAELGTKVVIGIFLLKLLAGVANGWVMSRTNYVADTWLYHNEGLKEYHLLFSNPKEYLLNFFQSSYATGYNGFFQTNQSYWNDLHSNIMIKLLSIFDVFSFGSYYVNVILFNFLIFFGNIGIYRVFAAIYKNKKIILVFSCFLLPSLLFFSSNIHKDGLLLAVIGVIVFNIYWGFHFSGFTFRRLIYIFLAVCFIFLLRNFVLMAILPALFAWVIAEKKKVSPILIFSIVYLIGGVIFFNLDKISPKLDLPEKVVQRQIDFLNLQKAATTINLKPLQPSAKSFIMNLPQVFNHIFMRPYLKEYHLQGFLLPFAVEIIFYELIFILFIFFHVKRKDWVINNPFVLFGIFFSVSILLIIGYTVPVIGAFIRYRSIYLLFILTPVLCNIRWEFFASRLQIKK